MKLLLGSLFVLALPFAVAHADRPGPGPGGRPPGPPRAAFDACAKAKAGDTCSMTFHDHTISGTCAQAPDSTALACRPDHPPGPPPEAIEACSGKASGDACSVSHDGHSMSGTCAQGPDGNAALACHPSGPPAR